MDRRTALVYYQNGTAESLPEDDPASAAATGLIILICFLLGVAYNLILVTAILCSHKLRNTSFHVAYVSMSATCLFDCFTNESIAFGFLLVDFVESCVISATCFHVFLLIHSASLSLLCVERTFSLFDHPLPVKMCYGGLLISWLFGLAFSSPLFGKSEIHYFINRNACSAVRSNYLLPIFTLIGLVLSSGVTMISVLFWMYLFNSFLMSERQLTTLSILPVSNVSQRSTLSFTTHDKNKLTCTIVFLYAILILPQTISVIIELFLTPSFLPDPWTDPRKSVQIRSVSTHGLEPLFTYSRYMYNVVVPIMILISDRDTRLQSRRIFCCRRNEISNTNLSLVNSTQSKILFSEPSSSDTPVLFATSRGLFLTVPEKMVPPIDPEGASTSDTNLKLSSTFCDSNAETTAESEVTRSLEEEIDEESEGNAVVRRNVRFSSKVKAIPPSESGTRSSGAWSPPVESTNRLDTHVVHSPLLVKDDGLVTPRYPGETYSKI